MLRSPPIAASCIMAGCVLLVLQYRSWKGKTTMMIPGKVATLSMVLTLTSLAVAADNDGNLRKETGVYNASSTGKTPGFVVDPAWPQPLPNNWRLGQVGGLYVDRHDHIWVYNRHLTLTNEEVRDEGPVPGAVDQKGQAVKRLGEGRSLVSS